MKILWFNHRDPRHPEAGGAEVRMREICKRLSGKGCSVTLFCEQWKGGMNEDFVDGIRIVRAGGKVGVHFKAPYMLMKMEDDYDVVVDDIAHAVPWLSSLFTKKPVIGQIHHVHQEVLSQELPRSLANGIALAEKTLKHFYKTLIAVSESTKKTIVEKIGVPANRIVVIQNGVDCNAYRPSKKATTPTILWVGRVKKYKRIEHFLLAFKMVLREVHNVKLVVVGHGDYLWTIKEFAKKLRLRNVVFKGRVSEREKTMLMGSSWVVVSTSQVEGWGMTLTESAACKTPAVAYNVLGVRDSIVNNVTGLLVEDGDIRALAKSLVRILSDFKLRTELSKNALKHANQFSWDHSAEKFRNVLEWVIGAN
ncbi:glycosyltransferase family 1 protein [Candidatus Bathyarchaeota archaeon]|nr:MAG: glycosyltransferase family 1 protein [Candidatus Bathyarchaeota archaeon]